MEIAIYKLSLQKRLKSLDSASIDVNKQLILNFVDHCFTERLSQHRILKYVSALKAIALKIQLDFDKIEKKDLFIFISELERSNRSQWLKHDYKVTLGKFYKWCCKEGSPEKVPDEIENGFWDQLILLIFRLCRNLEFNSNILTTFLFILYTISLSFYLFNLGIKFSCPEKRSWLEIEKNNHWYEKEKKIRYC